MNGVPEMNPRGLAEFLERGPVSALEMAAIERNAIALGVGVLQMMEAAGAALAAAARARHAERILLLCGKGNNGADGFVAARHLQHEAQVEVIHVEGEGRTKENLHQFRTLMSCAVGLHPVMHASDAMALAPLFGQADLIVDALLGTGQSGPLREPYRELVDLANGAGAFVLSADVPTPGIRADSVLSFHRPKAEGSDVAGIGIPVEAEIFVGPGDLLLVPRKAREAHKGMGGRVLVVGGGPYQGAPYLCALAALRAGADLVRVASPVSLPYPDLIHVRLEGERFGQEHLELLSKLAPWADTTVIGPGLGDRSHDAVLALSAGCRRLVIDGDALRLPLPSGESTIYTPHAGEFARITGRMPPESLPERGRAVRDAARGKGVILLKGPVDVISDGKRVRFNRTGTPAMTVGGTGDVLAGIVAALFCRMPGFEAACVSAYVNGIAGSAASGGGDTGLLASDSLAEIPKALRGGSDA